MLGTVPAEQRLPHWNCSAQACPLWLAVRACFADEEDQRQREDPTNRQAVAACYNKTKKQSKHVYHCISTFTILYIEGIVVVNNIWGLRKMATLPRCKSWISSGLSDPIKFHNISKFNPNYNGLNNFPHFQCNFPIIARNFQVPHFQFVVGILTISVKWVKYARCNSDACPP